MFRRLGLMPTLWWQVAGGRAWLIFTNGVRTGSGPNGVTGPNGGGPNGVGPNGVRLTFCTLPSKVQNVSLTLRPYHYTEISFIFYEDSDMRHTKNLFGRFLRFLSLRKPVPNGVPNGVRLTFCTLPSKVQNVSLTLRPGTATMPMGSPTPWAARGPTPGGSTTWRGTLASGARIGMTGGTTRSRLPTIHRALRQRHGRRSSRDLHAAAVGTRTARLAGRRRETPGRSVCITRPWGSGSRGLLKGSKRP